MHVEAWRRLSRIQLRRAMVNPGAASTGDQRQAADYVGAIGVPHAIATRRGYQPSLLIEPQRSTTSAMSSSNSSTSSPTTPTNHRHHPTSHFIRTEHVWKTGLAVFGYVMSVTAWDELISGTQLPDGVWIALFGPPAFLASTAWLARHLGTLLPETSDGQPRRIVSHLPALVFFIPGGALYIAYSVLRTTRDRLRGASSLLWLGWAISCAGMQISMIAELTDASLTLTFDGLYAAFGVLNAIAVSTLMWTPPRKPPLRDTICPTSA